MGVSRMAYVTCDECGAPATQPVEGGYVEAIRAMPGAWTRKPLEGFRCPDCQYKPTNQSDGAS